VISSSESGEKATFFGKGRPRWGTNHEKTMGKCWKMLENCHLTIGKWWFNENL